MIPQRLLVKNFMCYRDDVPPLELGGIHVACLCGDNGHGKTALLDAITWALWGQARARTHEELIHQGRQDMSVELDFLSRHQRYRVRRRYSKSGRSKQGTTILQLQVSSNDGYREISGNTVRETEARVRELLHMDYDTFINTAFLLQGQADTFTKSTPAQRKEALAEVLDLSYYEAMEERCKERSRQRDERITDIDSAIAVRQVEASRRPQQEDALAKVNGHLQGLGPEVEAQRQTVARSRQSIDLLITREEELETLARRRESGRQETAVLEAQARTLQERIDGYHAVMARDEEVRAKFRLLEDARSDLERLNQASQHAGRLERDVARLSQIVAVQRERLTGSLEQARRMVSLDLEPQAKRLPDIEESLRKLAGEDSDLEGLRREIEEGRQEAQNLNSMVEYLGRSNADLRVEMEDTRRKFDMLEKEDATCPVCKQPLGREGQQHLRVEYEAVGQKAKGLYTEQEEKLKAASLKSEELTAGISLKETDFNRRRQHTEASIAAAERELEDARKARDLLAPALADIETLASDLENENFAHDEQAALLKLHSVMDDLGYDQEAHQAVTRQVTNLEPYGELHRKLQEAREALPKEQEALESALQAIDSRRLQAQQDDARVGDLKEALSSLPRQRRELADAQSRLEGQEEQERNALVQQGVLEKQLEQCARIERELKEHVSHRYKLVEEKGVYDELTVAFGKNGIQALIIETAIPQIQDDANELLGRLTENRMFLKLQLREGRRERRMGLPSEDLEIRISDEVGTRSYETFSGGESFRINFALRIALSKLLARRSGAPLPILFIDEGFGSQDYVGQERLKEAIQSIQGDFEKIIVITHVEQVKESFPVRIEVTKTDTGSTFVVV